MFSRYVRYYVFKSGRSPFLDWMGKLDLKSEIIVDRFIQRVAQGGAKKAIKNLKDGVFEIKIAYASGLRVYFAEEGEETIILLTGGNKSSQVRDIKKAKEYWSNYGK